MHPPAAYRSCLQATELALRIDFEPVRLTVVRKLEIEDSHSETKPVEHILQLQDYFRLKIRLLYNTVQWVTPIQSLCS